MFKLEWFDDLAAEEAAELDPFDDFYYYDDLEWWASRALEEELRLQDLIDRYGTE